ncbi:DUF742 domain-containing protein [Allostreptomyces psammosilenae]|nr:DUF742 domain-containing protein [Allostreptomyces psammosilenae]
MEDPHGNSYGNGYGAPGQDPYGGGYQQPSYGEQPYEQPYRDGGGWQHPQGPGTHAPGAVPDQRPAAPDPDPGGGGARGASGRDGDGGGYRTTRGSQPLVRPYAMTRGRTRPRYQLAIEALVQTTGPTDRTPGLLPEHRKICGLCQDVKSVAEISALLTIPLGVARILVADLAEAGVVAIHQPGGADAGQPDVTLLERVLSGLRKL